MHRSILCTSSSGLDNLDIEHNVELIRLRIHLNNVEFIDGKNITTDKLCKFMQQDESSGVYTTPAPASEIRAQFQRLKKQGCQEIFVNSLSSKLSESYSIIKAVAEEFEQDMDIYVYDCRELNICESLLALEAAYLTKQGWSMPNIAKRLDILRASHRMHFAIQDITYLIKNNKMSYVSGFITNLFDIKLILEIDQNGKVIPAKKIRHFQRALDQLIKQSETISKRNDVFAYILSSGNSALDAYFLKMLRNTMGVKNIPILPASAISIANHGPTGIGLCYFESEIPHCAQMLIPTI